MADMTPEQAFEAAKKINPAVYKVRREMEFPSPNGDLFCAYTLDGTGAIVWGSWERMLKSLTERMEASK